MGGMKPMPMSLWVVAVVGLFTAVFSGCSTAAPVVSDWRNPAYASAAFRRIMVGGPTGDTSVRRNFEDEFVSQLRAVGIDALPSYRFLPENQETDENTLKQAAQKAQAGGLLFVRSVKVEQKTNYPAPAPDISFGVFGSNAGAVWSGLGTGSGPYRYSEYTSETALLDMAKNELVWTGMIRTKEPANVQTAIKSYVETVMKSLQGQNLLPRE